METVWCHSPITAISFTSPDNLLSASGNRIDYYDIHLSSLLHSYEFLPFIAIHEITTKKVNGFRIVAIGGNRIRAGLTLGASGLQLVFADYKCDNIISCCIEEYGDTFHLCYLSAHGEVCLNILTISIDGESLQRQNESIHINVSSDISYSGYIIYQPLLKTSNLVTFMGSTFGSISIKLLDGSNSHLSTVRQTVLSSQKGIILSISLCSMYDSQCHRIAAAAEDRSIVIWTSKYVHKVADSKEYSVLDFLGPWDLVTKLNCGAVSPLDAIFCGRIWRICVNHYGLVAVGEDCQIIAYRWTSLSEELSNEGTEDVPCKILTKPNLIEDTHRGRSIWCLSAILKGGNCCEWLLATGGNDGAICVQLLPASAPVGYQSTLVSLSLPTSEIYPSGAIVTSDQSTQAKLGKKADDVPEGHHVNDVFSTDFPRCIFFSPDGRLFIITNLGLIFTYDYKPDAGDQVSLSELHVVLPYFYSSLTTCLRDIHYGIAYSQQKANGVTGDHCKSVEFCIVPPSEKLMLYLRSGFHGYLVAATSLLQSFVVLGDRNGHVGLFQLLRDRPYLVMSDIILVKHKVMKLIWISNNYLVMCLQADHSVLVRITWSSGQGRAQFDRSCMVSLHLPAARTDKRSTSSLRWFTAATTGASDQSPLTSTLVVGSRDGGLYTFGVSGGDRDDSEALLGDTTEASLLCSIFACHGRGGCTSLASLASTSAAGGGSGSVLVVSCGRTYGDVCRWRLDTSTGSLSLLGTINSPDGFTWIERLFTVPSRANHIVALGFHSVYFKAYTLFSTNSSPDCALDENRLSHHHGAFEADCNGSNRYWDWYPGGGFLLRSPPRLELTSMGCCCPGEHCASTCLQLTLSSGDLDEKAALNSPSLLATINHGGVLLQESCLRPRKDPIYLTSGLNGRDLNSCLALGHPVDRSAQSMPSAVDSDPVGHDLIIYCLAGGEDTLLSSWALKVSPDASLPLNDSLGVRKTSCSLASPPIHHRGHVSNIRCITVPLMVSDTPENVMPSSDYLLTGGGRGQICLWSLGVGRQGGCDARATKCSSDLPQGPDQPVAASTFNWRPGLLGSVRLSKPLGSRGKQKPPMDACELRVMAMVCVQWTGPLTGHREMYPLLLLAACSDGSLRLLAVSPPTREQPVATKFLEIACLNAEDQEFTGSLRHVHNSAEFQPNSCWLDIKLIDFHSNQLAVAAVNTSGCLSGWQILLQPLSSSETDSDTLDADSLTVAYSVHHLWHLLNHPTTDTSKDDTGSHLLEAHKTPCALNTLSMVCKTRTLTIVAVGSDDGSLLMVTVPLDKSTLTRGPVWTARSRHHAAALLRVQPLASPVTLTDCTSHHRLVTLSADQRVILWSLWHHSLTAGDHSSPVSGMRSRLQPLRRLILSGLGDPHGLAGVSLLGCCARVPGKGEQTPGWEATEFVLATGTGCRLLRFPSE